MNDYTHTHVHTYMGCTANEHAWPGIYHMHMYVHMHKYIYILHAFTQKLKGYKVVFSAPEAAAVQAVRHPSYVCTHTRMPSGNRVKYSANCTNTAASKHYKCTKVSKI